jgi:hypothetical protein
MRNINLLLALIIILGFSTMLVGQSKSNFGINTGIADRVGKLSSDYKPGCHFGFIGRISVQSPIVMIAGGIIYSHLPGSTKTFSGPGFSSTTTHDNLNLISVFVGPQFGKEDGFYFLPSICGNFYEGNTRFGLNIGLGELYPVGTKSAKFDCGGKFSIINLIGKDKDEVAANMISIYIGLVF